MTSVSDEPHDLQVSAKDMRAIRSAQVTRQFLPVRSKFIIVVWAISRPYPSTQSRDDELRKTLFVQRSLYLLCT